MSLSLPTTVEPDLCDVHLLPNTFWAGRVDSARNGALPAIHGQMKQTGRWDCFKLKWRPGDPHKPHRFWDSDVAKWLEAACYSLLRHPDPELAALVEEAINDIRGAQQEDGYINVYYSVVEPGKRWTNIAWSHEMYDAGHLLEAALAHHIYSGSTRLLEPILRYINHIRTVFGPEKGQKHGYPGHQELELALLKTFDFLSNTPSGYASPVAHTVVLDLAAYLIDERGRVRSEGHYFDVEACARGEKEGDPGPAPKGEPRFSYYQADRKVREVHDVNGHSVRAMYWSAAVAHLARLKRDKALVEAAERLWISTTERKMYITGGLGAVGDWEGFGPDYFLPNETGYLETCAAIGLVLFARQMLHLNPYNDHYATVMERALCNGVLVGMGLDGKSFFYENPLATIKTYERSTWFSVSCCPPNVARLLLSIEKYVYTYTPEDNTLHIHMLIASLIDVSLPSGKRIRLSQNGSPWQAGVTITIEGEGYDELKVRLRVPEGAMDFEISKAESTAHHVLESSSTTFAFRPLTSSSKTKAILTCTYSLPPRIVHPHPLNTDNHHHVAFMRGPLVYCVESLDNPHVVDLRALRVNRDAGAHVDVKIEDVAFAQWGMKNVPVLEVDTVLLGAGPGGGGHAAPARMIPIFLWANRGPSVMRVWLPSAI